MDGLGDLAEVALARIPASALDAQPGLRARLESLASRARRPGAPPPTV